jgi:hypothetical protein
MSNIYRIYPVLWEGAGCTGSQQVYACDRQPPPDTFPTTCSSRPRADPASVWENTTFWRLLPPPDVVAACYQPAAYAAVTWYTLPAWLSWVQGRGYSLQGGVALSTLKPHSDLYIVGP